MKPEELKVGMWCTDWNERDCLRHVTALANGRVYYDHHKKLWPAVARHTCRARYWLRGDGKWFGAELDRAFAYAVLGTVSVYIGGVESTRTIFDAKTEDDAKAKAEFVMRRLLGVRE